MEHLDNVSRAINCLERTIPTLYALQVRDQRFGAKIFYERRGFISVVDAYLSDAVQLRDGWNEHNYRKLSESATKFLRFVQDELFPEDKSRMLTTLSRKTGASFKELYKDTVELTKLLQFPFRDNSGLEKIDIPEQKSSPIYTKVENNRVVLDSGHALHPFLRREGVAQTRAYLRNELSELSDGLRLSNVDRKYVDVFAKLPLLIAFEDDAGAISFGLHVRLVSQLTKHIEGEISDVLAVQIASTLTHAAYFASQYKDWVEFLRNALDYPSRLAIEGEIENALEAVAETLAQSADTVDQRIPESIRLITSLMKGTREDRINAIYAGVRGVENICVSMIKYAYDQAVQLLKDSGNKARPMLVRIGAVTIIGIALTVIATFMPVIKNASELNWIIENLPRIEKIGHILK